VCGRKRACRREFTGRHPVHERSRGLTVLYLVNADHSGLKRLARHGEEPVWSPDGSRVAYISEPNVGDPGLGEIWVVSATGGDPTRLARTHFGSFSWSPDGTRIVYNGEPHEGGLVVAAADGYGAKTVLTPDGALPAWSPDGRTIAFIRASAGSESGDLYAIDAAGGSERLLASDVAEDPPVWSPDGRTIAFTRAETVARSRDIYVVGADDGSERRLVSNTTDAAPVWSPDRSRILFVREDSHFDLNPYVAATDGSGERKLTSQAAAAGSFPELTAAWSPDGSAIAVSGSFKSHEQTFVVKPDGSGLRLVDRGGGGASWSPDGTSLALIRGEDVWVVAADGSSRRRVTDAARYGYQNASPLWHPRGARSEQLGGVPVSPAIPTESIANNGILRTRARIHRLAADGARVVVAYDDPPTASNFGSRVGARSCASPRTTFAATPTRVRAGFSSSRSQENDWRGSPTSMGPTSIGTCRLRRWRDGCREALHSSNSASAGARSAAPAICSAAAVSLSSTRGDTAASGRWMACCGGARPPRQADPGRENGADGAGGRR
jgi:TolB protein